MKKSVVLFVLFAVVAHPVFAETSSKGLNEIIKLRESGQYQQALEQHILFHEESKSSPGMGGVRLSYAISAWHELGKKYPPALEVLVKIRDKNKDILLSGKGSFENFHELSSINRELGKDEETVELFLILDNQFSTQAQSYFIAVKDLLIARKEYKLCGKYLGDPIQNYENIRHMREMQLSLIRTDPEMDTADFRKITDESFINDVLKLIEVLVAIEKQDEAREIQKRALSYFDNERIKEAIR